jgi:hypothetical protein
LFAETIGQLVNHTSFQSSGTVVATLVLSVTVMTSLLDEGYGSASDRLAVVDLSSHPRSTGVRSHHPVHLTRADIASPAMGGETSIRRG